MLPSPPTWRDLVNLLRSILGWAPLTVLGLGLVAAAAGTAITQQSANDLRDSHITAASRRVAEAIQTELNSYARVLRTGAAFFDSSKAVTRDEWAQFVERLEITRSYPGIVGYAYVEKVPRDGLDQFAETMRRDGVPNFEISAPFGDELLPPEGPAFVVAYHEPAAHNAHAWGIDLSRRAFNREVYVNSAAVGDARLSVPLSLRQSARNSVVMAYPLRSRSGPLPPEEGLNATRGWIASPIDLNDFLTSINNPERHRFQLTLSWATPADAEVVLADIHRSNPAPLLDDPANIRESGFSFGGTQFTLTLTPYDIPENHAATNTSTAVAIGGGSVSVLLMLIVASLSHTRFRAERLAESMTQSLAESEAEQRRLADRANAASEAKSAFLANMSHELRTPLNAVLGYSDVLDDSLPAPQSNETREALAAIRASSNHLLTIINDVLDLAKIEAGKLPMRPEPLDPRDPVRTVVDMMKLPAQRRSLELVCDFDDSLPDRAMIDPVRLRQILINLVGNAIKFSDRGTVRVHAACEGDEVVTRVVDQGRGIPDATLGRLFRSFEQGDHSATKRHEGTGLGLAISRRLAEMMGGTLTATSTMGIGSVFTLRIPLRSAEDCKSLPALDAATGHAPHHAPDRAEARAEARADARADARAADALAEQVLPITEAAPAEAVASAVPDLVGARVLVVDDGIDNRRIVTHLLHRAGAIMTEATSGEEALDLVRTGSRFDLILMDHQMPGMDGPTATGAIRAIDPRTPIVAVTADAQDETRERFLDAGANGFAAKPINRDALLQLVRFHTRPPTGQRAPLSPEATNANNAAA